MILELSGGIAFMSRSETLERWKQIMDGYQAGAETVTEYCKRLNVCTRMFYHYRLAIYGPTKRSSSKESRLLPVVAEPPEQTTVSVNRIQLSYTNITDQELSRILRLCRDL